MFYVNVCVDFWISHYYHRQHVISDPIQLQSNSSLTNQHMGIFTWVNLKTWTLKVLFCGQISKINFFFFKPIFSLCKCVWLLVTKVNNKYWCFSYFTEIWGFFSEPNREKSFFVISTVYKISLIKQTKKKNSPFTCAPKPKEVFAKLWKAAYPIYIGHWPGVSAAHRNIAAFCPLFALMCLCNFPPMVAYTFVTPLSSGQASAYRPRLQTTMLTLLGDLWHLLGFWTHNLLLDSRNSLSLTLLGC